MAKKEKEVGKFKPTEIGEIINTNLMNKPNKSVVFKSFVNSIIDHQKFILNYINHIPQPDTTLLKAVIEITNKRIEDVKALEIDKTQKQINELQDKLKSLKTMTAVENFLKK